MSVCLLLLQQKVHEQLLYLIIIHDTLHNKSKEFGILCGTHAFFSQWLQFYSLGFIMSCKRNDFPEYTFAQYYLRKIQKKNLQKTFFNLTMPFNTSKEREKNVIVNDLCMDKFGSLHNDPKPQPQTMCDRFTNRILVLLPIYTANTRSRCIGNILLNTANDICLLYINR